MLQREPLDIDRRIGLAHHALIFHDLSRDLSQTSEFTLEESDRPSIELQDSVLNPIEVALHGSDRSTDLMRDIREEIRANLLLYREGFMEIIDRGDEGLELIVFRVLDVRIILASDDTLEILDDGLDGEKY